MNTDWSEYLNAATFEKILRVLIILAVGIATIYFIAFLLKKILPKKWSRQRKMIIDRAFQYTGFIILFFILIAELNINLAPIFGAAGVIGLIVGIASQTSIGNIISGFFLVSEKSFEIGDVIRLGDKTGTVYSIDLLSIKIRTFDNLLIRIPNQTVISTELTNVTRFPIRRMDVLVSVAYKEDLERVKTILENVVKENPLCLDEPEPVIIFQSFGASGIDIQLGVWTERVNYLNVKNSVFREIKEAFDKEGIEIPFPHISLYSGEATKPFPVNLKK
ncbi:Mechanosensitive ion channel [Mariniphaga anaerophila]|uniref:Mechanosensitive ion channel n=1 Tax=Mariniphaga anaerophila TaxID=1484053 RepID=A0A1M4T6P9_9BACT|nr:mechanosensitive ion channel family protein [Mariniphaga anaerophila]SHE40139.1 Mechanosensitive ion channel [Mariniphaga anaerophila]